MNWAAQRRGAAAYVGLMLIAVTLLGGMLSLNTAALVSLGAASRAFELARQDRIVAARLERMTREAAQAAFGTGTAVQRPSLGDELRASVDRFGFGDVGITRVEVRSTPPQPAWFPVFSESLPALGAPSRQLMAIATPQLRQWMGNDIAESQTFTAHFVATRKGFVREQRYAVDVDCRLVAVPLTRFGCVPYDLPQEIGEWEGTPRWPAGIPCDALSPLGLVPSRDSADIARWDRSSSVVPEEQAVRPLHFRYASLLLEAYQHVFSSPYLQRVADYAGGTHFISLGGASVNPMLAGGREIAGGYELDVGEFGAGTLGGNTDTRNAVVFCASAAAQRLTLSDSGGSSEALVVVALGPSDAALGPLVVELKSDLTRPLVLIGCKVQLLAPAGARLNGALLLDPECSVSAAGGQLQVGHVSFWAGGSIQPEVFRLGPMPAAAAALSPRVVYVATSKLLH